MDLSATDIEQIKQAVEARARSYHHAHFSRGEGSLEHCLAHFSDDVIAVGTGAEEVIFGKAGLIPFFEREWEEVPEDISHTIHRVEVLVQSSQSASVQSFLDIQIGDPETHPPVPARFTLVLRQEGGEWLISHLHGSVPWDAQSEGVSWPSDELKARAEKLEAEVAQRTKELSRANRELAVDAALERIRRVTADMEDPSDLIEVVKQIKVEVDALFGDTLLEVGLMLEADEETFRFWAILDVNEVPEDLAQFGLLYPKKPDPPHPLLDRLWDSEGRYSILHFDLDDMWQVHASLAHYVPKEAELLKAALDGGMRGGWCSASSIQVGRMYLSWMAEPPEEVASIQPRIANVLSEAQQRVEELREAQRLTREAQFESSLERIRRAASQMVGPSDLKLVLGQVKHEIEDLFAGKILEIAILREDEDNIYSWNILDVTEDHAESTEQAGMPFPKDLDPPHPVLTKVFGRDERFFQFQWGVESVMVAYRYAAERFPEMGAQLRPRIEAGAFDNMWSAISVLSDARFKTSWLSEPPAEIASIQPRIADELDLAFKRVEELEAAHLRALEARVEAAVERVRGRALAMRESTEILDVAVEILHQMMKLDVVVMTATSISIEVEPGLIRHVDVTAPNPENPDQVGLMDFTFELSSMEPPNFFLEEWRHQGDYWTNHAFGDNLSNSIDWLSQYQPEQAAQYRAAFEAGHFAEFWQGVVPITDGRLSVGLFEPAPPELEWILPKFGKAFDLAYSRFKDLEMAEAQAREAEINLAVEKVRARASGMQTSSEIVDVADVLREQLVQLGLSDVMACTVYTRTPDGQHRVTEMARLEEGSSELSFDWVFDPAELNPDVMVHDFLAAETATVFHEDTEAMALLLKEALKFDPDYVEDYEQAVNESGISEVWVAVHPAESVRLCIDFKTEPPEEILTILPRMARAFDHAYRRHQDLERAEAQAREAQIEAALERVRGRALAMRSSDELNEVADELRRQMGILGQTDLEVCTIHIYDIEGDDFETWGVINDPSKDGPVETEVRLFPRKGVPILEEIIAAYESDENNHVFLNDGEKAAGFFGMLQERHPDVLERLMSLIPPGLKPSDMKAWWSFSDFSGGSLGIVTYKPADPQSLDLLERTARVFDLAYRRFKDLQEAEAAAREARIENALEKIRSRTMGMQTGEELKDVVVLLYKELIALGVTDFVTCGYVEINEDEQIQDTWVTSPGGDTFGLFHLPLQGDATFDARYAAWKRQEPIFHQTVAGQERSDHLEYAITKFNSKEAEEMVRSQFPDPTVFYCFNFSHGYLHIVGGSLLEKEEELLVARFTKVFEQTYTRFLDLQKAEAAARESQIEAALERVRAVATAMRSSNELLKVMQHIHKEFSALGFPCGAFWNSRYLETHYEKAVTDMDGSQVTAIMELPRDFSMIPELAAWERSTEKLGVFKFGTEASIEYLNHMINKGKFLEIVPGALTEELLREKGGWTFIQARTTHGELGYNLWGETDPSEEATDTLLRFAGVFDLAFRRFVDLEEAEEAAREALIEVALERVRSRAMAMRDSVELTETLGVMFDQMKDLGFTPVSTFLTLMDEDLEGMTFRMTGREGSRNLIDVRWESTSMTQFQEVRDAWQRGDNILGAHYTGESLDAFLEIIEPINAQLPNDAQLLPSAFQDGLYSCSGRHAFGTLGILTDEPVQDDEKDLLTRFAKEFELVYRRFLDLQKAEAQAREARIEMSLEGVRAQAMAMQKPEDISDVAIRMFDELETLGIESLRSGISIPGDDGRYVFHAATKDESGSTTIVLGEESVDVHPIIRRAYDGWKQQESFQQTILAGKDLVDYYHAVFDTMPLPDWKERMQQGEAATEGFATFPFQDGWLYTFVRREFQEPELDLYRRFARVFGLAYQRYHDLKMAEEQARESQIEAALERVRAQAMAMQKPEDIGEATYQMFEEIRALSPGVLRMGLGIPDASKRQVQPWLVGKDDAGQVKILRGRMLTEGDRPELDETVHAWERGEHYWFKESREFLEWAPTIYESAGLDRVIVPDVDYDQYFCSFAYKTGFLYLITKQPETEETETGSIAIRFGSVFDLAYQRYHDLQQSEKDYKALLDEKARTEKALSDLQATQKQLVEQEKLASLGSLTAGIAHEIKNPLNFVNNFAEVSTELMEELAEAVAKGDTEEAAMILEDLRDNATQIAKHGKRADSIVRSMMQHARGGASEMETIVVNEFLEEYANLSWHGMRARDHGFSADIERAFDPDAGELKVMPQELGRVVLNLINNAFDAVKEMENGLVTVASERSNDALIIRVSDNGPGIPEEIRQKIFEPFFTTKATGEGTGLGLSLSYDIVTKGHGGTMTVSDSPDGGALFTISLPLQV